MPGPRLATPADVTAVSAVLARAFLDDPVMGYLLPRDHRRLPKLTRLMRAAAHKASHDGELWTTEGHAGAAAWSAPGRWKVRGLAAVREAPLAFVFGRHLPRAIAYLRRTEASHPRAPHWYLAVLGTDPPEQGKGVGSALMRPVLDRCDAEGVPAYLESSKESNIPFYERHGFVVTRTIDCPGGPTVWPMWRDPRPPET